jgi:2-amino-4-hydroxy-6-hydroxymethyldihydropteridine diphosphokinase
MKYFLSIGSNLEDREKNLSQTQLLLEKEGVEILKESSLYKTQPVDFSSKSWFYNQVLEVKANVKPEALLTLIKKIEQKMGRDLPAKKAPRIIDIDILLAEKTVIRTKKLEIPHPRMEKRNFVLVPFSEISPDIVHPLLNISVKDILKKSNDPSIVSQIKKKIIHKEG